LFCKRLFRLVGETSEFKRHGIRRGLGYNGEKYLSVEKKR